MLDEEKIRVLLVDDHTLVRAGLVFALSTLPDIEVVGEAGDGERAVALCAQLQPDVVLMDVVMPHMDGIEATRRIRSLFPLIQVVVLTGFQETDLVENALQAGASAYVLKGISYLELVTIVRAGYARQLSLAPEGGSRVPYAQTLIPPLRTTLDDFSRQGWEVFA